MSDEVPFEQQIQTSAKGITPCLEEAPEIHLRREGKSIDDEVLHAHTTLDFLIGTVNIDPPATLDCPSHGSFCPKYRNDSFSLVDGGLIFG